MGFNIVDEQEAPLVSFGYMDPTAAAQATPLIKRGIAEAVLISQAGL